MTNERPIELTVLRMAARGDLHPGARSGEYVHNGRVVDGDQAVAITAAMRARYLALTVDPAAGRSRLELTVPGFQRIDQLLHHMLEPV
jgi:hypothetical protein